MTDPVIPPEAVGAFSEAYLLEILSRVSTASLPSNSAVRAGLTAALPHLRPLFEVATQVGLELGRRGVAEEIAVAIGKLPTHADGRQIVGLDMRLMAEKVARDVATRTAGARTDPSGHTDLPPTPDALSNRLPEETP